MPRALITGITGQDGSYLAEFLLTKGYEVFGLVRPGATPRTSNISHLIENPAEVYARPNKGPFITLLYGDMTDPASIARVLETAKPDEIYNLAAQAHVKISFDMPEYTVDATGVGVLRLLEAVRWICPQARIYQAGSSEMFGASPPPQDESTPFLPRSPYACAKVFAYQIARNYREAYGLRISCGILFNHESERRAQHYVTRKVSLSVARIVRKLQHELRLGNLDARRDWGYAKEYVTGMWMMLQQDPSDFVLATGIDYSVGDMVKTAFDHVGLDWHDYYVFDPKFLRPTEVDHLRGDPSKALTVLGWKPSVFMPELIKLMVEADLDRIDVSKAKTA